MTIASGLIDLHIHTTVSDGTDTPEELFGKVKDAGISLFSVTDHDAIRAAKTLSPLCEKDGPRFLPGVEFSCRDRGGKYHILAYGFDPASEPLNALVKRGQLLRADKLLARVAYLRETFGIEFPEEEIFRLLAESNPGKPHLANLMIKYGYAITFRSAMEKYLDRLPSAAEYICPEEAIAGILSGGGIPILAHPLVGSGREYLTDEEMERRLTRLKEYGLAGIEAFYSGFTREMTKGLLEKADKYGLLVTAGSDYHGTNKTVRLGETGLPDPADYPSAFLRFLSRVGV